MVGLPHQDRPLRAPPTVARAPGGLARAGRWRSMIAPIVDARRQRAEGAAPVAGQARSAERVGDRRVAVADEQRALQRERHPLDDAAGARLERLEVGTSRRFSRSTRRPRRGSAPPPARSRRRRRRPTAGLFTIARSTSRHIDVAGALPDRVERRLAVQARHARLLDVAVAAEALERLDARAPAPRLQIQYFDTAVASRLNRFSRSSLARPRRRRAPAASRRSSRPRTRRTGRRARSASAAGRSAACRRRARCAAWWVACATAGAHARGRRRSRSRAACG